MMKTIPFVCLISLLALPANAANTGMDLEFQLNGAAIQAHAEFLASDLLEGRAAGSRGYDLAAAYVASQFRQYGLRPIKENGYLQRVPLIEATVVLPGSSMIFKHDNTTDTFEYGSDYLPAANFFTSPISLTAPLAFVGFGITAPELKYDDLANVDLQGRIAVMLEGAPKKFRPALREYYSWPDTKYANLIRHGAIAVIEIIRDEIPTDNSDEQESAWDQAVATSWISDMRRVNSDDEAVDPFAELKIKMHFNAASASKLFAGSHGWDQVVNNANASVAQGFALPGTLTLSTTTGLRRTESNNVVGMIAGSDPDLRREYVMVVAHLDHLGRGAAVNGDTVYNGMQHNATGVAMLLELARAIATTSQKPKRSILFVAATAGNKSAQGLQHLLKAGSIPINNIVAAINIDTPLPLMRTTDVIATGADQSTLGNTVNTVLQSMDMHLATSGVIDHSLTNNELSPYVQAGIPMIELHAGNHARSGHDDMRDLKRDYFQNHFNQPSDDATAAMDMEAARELDEVNARILIEIANSATRPQWYRSSVLHSKTRR
jgi:hypothetical protein